MPIRITQNGCAPQWFGCGSVIGFRLLFNPPWCGQSETVKINVFSIYFPPSLWHGRAFITSNGPSFIFCLFRPLSTEFIKCHRTRENFHFLRLTLSSFVVSWTPGLIIGFSFFGTLCKRSVEWNSWFVYHSCNSSYGMLHSLPCHS